MSRKIVFELNHGKQIKVTEEEFATLGLSEILKDQSSQWIDLGPRGFQKYSLQSWDYEKEEEVKEEVEGIVQ